MVMGKRRARAVEKRVLDQNLGVSSNRSLNLPPAPVYYPGEEEFKDPIEYIHKIRPEAEPYGICMIVPPKCWRPPFALNLESFKFPTKAQEIHRLQARPAACDPKTFQLEYNRFLEEQSGRKLKKKVTFEEEELDLCKLFHAVKRFGGYDNVVKRKKWGEVYHFVRSGRKISECAKHVLCQLFKEHLYDYEKYYNRLNKDMAKCCKSGMHGVDFPILKRRKRNDDGENVKICDLEDDGLDQVCEQCKSGLHGQVMLLCDRCNKGWHIYCLSPPLKQIPPGNWYCFECLNSDEDSFGFVPGKCFSLEEFKCLADRAKRKWFGVGRVSRMQMEKKFWSIVEGFTSEVEVMYGSDLDTSVYGSGFPRINDQRPESVDAKTWDGYCSNPWNLNNLPKLKGSMLRAVRNSITGVIVPWLYIGMLFSSFCWHFEDHCFYSINYLHWGEPKCWYGVPGSEASAFEKVMRKTLPDLFDAQPDLLFQLVTMLKPSVLQENGVPVYTVLQEPGNFVITFPRSFHAGFNFGLNCAEAVNFAPADWLPHGSFGAELYQLYRKPSVISHEELLCVVAKGDCDKRVSTHLMKELRRIYNKEKTWRERLWRSGVLKSSSLPPQNRSDYVGTEEDPSCIICQQYLYLSAVVCCCRPSSFVCLEHWKHLCECKPGKRCLLYRYTLAELHELIITVDKSSWKAQQSNNRQRQNSGPRGSGTSYRKAKGGCVTQAELAEEWLLRSCKVFQNAFSSDEYDMLLKEAEQFLWADSEMDPVRAVVKNLIEAKKWAEAVRDCLQNVENRSHHHAVDKLQLEYVDELLSVNPVPCVELSHLKLKDYAEKARMLSQEIDSALSSCPTMSELDLLYFRVSESPFSLSQNKILSQKISSAKMCGKRVRKCLSDSQPAGIELDTLCKLKSEILELQVQLPETDLLLDLLRQTESCRAKCNEILNGSICLKSVEILLQELNSFSINIPELNTLRQYRNDTVSWIAHFNNIMVNVQEREDQQKVVEELKSLLEEGASLKIKVEELPRVEVELKRASCREKAWKACTMKMPLNIIKQLMAEAVVLQIEEEKLFRHVSELFEAAVCWEERASGILDSEAQMSDLKGLLRKSEDIYVILPSMEDVKNAVLVAESWLEKSKTFLVSASSVTHASCFLLELGILKELVSESTLLKVSLEEPRMLERLLVNCEKWQAHACSLLQEAECLLDATDIRDDMHIANILKVEGLISRLESARKSGLSLGFNFDELPKLQTACIKLQWCSKIISLSSIAPSSEEVERLLETGQQLSITCASGRLWSLLVEGIRWLRRALKVLSLPQDSGRCKLDDAEEVLADSKGISVSFQYTIGQLENGIQKHKFWQAQAHQFFNLKCEDRSWSHLQQINELGKVSAFKCPELDMVLSEVENFEKWKQHCMDSLGRFADDALPLLDCLQKVKESLYRSLCIYQKSECLETMILCICCRACPEDQPFLTCLRCKDRYHVECLGQTQVDETETESVCFYCQFPNNGSICQLGDSPRKFDWKCPDITILTELLSDAASFRVRIDEREMLQQILEQATACNACLREILDFTSSFLGRDYSIVSKKLSIALKAVNVAKVHDREINPDLELALAIHSWRIRTNKLLTGLPKPSFSQIQQHLKEGLALNILPGDYFRQRLTKLECSGLQWAERAKKVVNDSGSLCLESVFDLVAEGENLPLHLDKELKLLQDRSMLNCICRKPYDARSMIACDQCGEWYHTYCIKLTSWPKKFVCSACHPHTEELVFTPRLDHERSISAKPVEPKTPSPQHTRSVKRTNRTKASLAQKMVAVAAPNSKLRNGFDSLWRKNGKGRRRAAKRRVQFDKLCSFSIHT